MYIALTVVCAVCLLISGMPLFDTLCITFGTAGTGGFGTLNASCAAYTYAQQSIVTIFMFLFGVNFSLYYLLLIGKIKEVVRSEEFRCYFITLVAAVGFVFLSLMGRFESFPQIYTTEEAFRHSLFQVVTLITTAGFTTTDYNVWPMLAKTTLVLVMFLGAMAGSTAGGMKISRFVIAMKGAYINVRKLINPRYVPKTKFEGKTLEQKTINDVFGFITLYSFIFLAVLFLLSFDPINGQTVSIVSDAGEYEVKHGFFSNFSAVLACISNVGPAFEAVGPYSSYVGFSAFSKIILSLTMMLGRLEILPVLILFNRRTWSKI